MNISSLRPTAVNAVLAKVREVTASGRAVVSLMRGEPDLATPSHIVEACVTALRNGRTGYPDNRGEMKLREAVCEKLARDNGLRYTPAEVLITSGATFGIYAALAAVLTEGEEVMLPNPVYDAYHSPVLLCGGRIRQVPSQIADGRFTLTAEALERAWNPACRALILNTPWNPVGTVFTEAEARAMAEFCERRNVWLLSDEIYETILFDRRRHYSPAAYCRERAIVINSLSKTYSMPGWRVGYCAAPKPVLDRMFMVLAQSSRGPATFVQDAAVVALTGPQDCIAAMREEYAARRAQVLDALRAQGAMTPEGGFFAMVDVRATGLASNEVRRRLLQEHGVVVIHGAAYGEQGEGTLRVSFASGGANLARGLEQLRAGLAAL
ncbi:MAG: aminotransferase class I/II-fold pyridoxal phosphate-dependent enzyme [Acidobacteria bacterium]|nr:aminotransferase class I/II-fold pyridoxal phosphate-dependent enzyme [Acidobacteriota bacterium]